MLKEKKKSNQLNKDLSKLHVSFVCCGGRSKSAINAELNKIA